MTTSTVESEQLPIIIDESFKYEKKMPIRYDINLLKIIVKRDKCIVDIDLYKYNTTRDTKIFFICNCGKKGNKIFRTLFEKGGGFCIKCTKSNALEKQKKTCLENLDVEFPTQSKEVRNKIKETNFKKLGVECSFQSEIVKEKIKKTNIKRHGYSNPMHNSEIAEKQLKNSYSSKDYILPSNKIIQIQGYEKHALDELLYIQNIEEEDIITSRIEVPEIWYYNNGANHKYYTDIYIKSQNKCIEVKSTWTSEDKKDIIKLKEEAVYKAGYNYEIRIYDRKGNRL